MVNVLDSVSKATLSGTAVIARMVGRIVIYRLDGDSESVSRSKTASPVISSTRAQYIVISRGKVHPRGLHMALLWEELRSRIHVRKVNPVTEKRFGTLGIVISCRHIHRVASRSGQSGHT